MCKSLELIEYLIACRRWVRKSNPQIKLPAVYMCVRRAHMALRTINQICNLPNLQSTRSAINQFPHGPVFGN